MITTSELKEQFGGNVSGADEYVKTLRPQYVERPKRLLLTKNATSQQVRTYATQIEVYERLIEEYNVLELENSKINLELDSVFEEYIKDISGLTTIVPEKYQSKLYSKAYEDGHSSGYNEIYNQLLGLIEIFE